MWRKPCFALLLLGLAVVVATPNAFHTVANWHNAFLHRIRTNMHSMMLAANNLNPLLVIHRDPYPTPPRCIFR